MKLKIVTVEGKTYAEVQDGKPVYEADGKDIAFDAPATVATITRLNGEAKGHREAKEAAEKSLAAFAGISDPEAALKALTTVKNLDDKKLVDAGEVEKVKQEAIKAIRAEFEPVVKERDTLKGELYGEKIGGSFARSKFISEKIAIPSDLLQARFGTNFEVKDGKIVAKDHAGNAIYSRSKPGEIADFEEAIELLVDAYPQKDAILKGTGSSGSGARGSNGVNNGAKTMPRSQFEALDPAARAAKMKEGFTLTEA
jgi:hypothetical protein